MALVRINAGYVIVKLVACFGAGLLHEGHHADALLLAAATHTLKNHNAFAGGENGVILADANIQARVEFGTALAHDNIPRDHSLPCVDLHAKPL